ncbi:MAG TPA: DUF4349 domain-containing protein [Thermoguttaceae bacterium]|nr:DUF4349 domain-containing protein [Thermoguttaceae bacterium]
MMRLLVVLVMVFALGCSAERLGMKGVPESAPAMAEADLGGSQGRDAGGEAESGQALPTQGALNRKIIYTATVDLVVEDFAPIPNQVEEVAKQFGGFVANSNVSGSPGYPRRGEWTLRVPVERYEEFLAEVRQRLGGEIQSVRVDSQDVIEEYFDVEARIRNKKKTEERLLKLLEERTGKLEDVLTVERELSRVREEIERVEGRLRVLGDLTSLTTIHLTVTEVKGYVPEAAPSYMTRVRRAFNASVAALVSAAQALSIAIVALSPWLAVLLVLAIVLGLLLRLAWRFRMRALERRVEVVDESSPSG